MELSTTESPSCRPGLTVELLRDLGPAREQCQRELLAGGLNLPLPHRIEWARTVCRGRSWFIAARDESGRCCGGFAIEPNPSRALPGHTLLRVARFPVDLPESTRDACLAMLADHARSSRRIVRLNIELFSRDPAARAASSSLLSRLGFRPVSEPRGYARTIAIDLSPDEPSLFASIHSTARRHIRAIAKHPLAIVPITDPTYATRLHALLDETMARTGGPRQHHDWASRIELSREYPSLSRIVGLLRTDRTGPDALLAFAWGCHHGAYAHYDAAASTRNTDLRVPLAYALVWDLLCWARQNGATWFDFGGVTDGHHGSADPLGGISDFKRYFGRQVLEIAEEWLLEPHPMRASLAETISAAAALARRFGAALRRPSRRDCLSGTPLASAGSAKGSTVGLPKNDERES